MNQLDILHKIFLECKSISIDTRKIEPDSLFFAIKGENFDANTFAKEALEKGAKYVVIDNENYFIDNRTILVKNSLETLQELATYHRRFLGIPIIALTGSNGKTTTKELINCVLKQKFITKATLGNLNNHIGVPLTLLSFDKNTEMGIVEMGANHQKEIEFLCSIANPDFGYITNFGKAHLEGFGGVEGVIKGKSELYDYLRTNQKIAFVNSDDQLQMTKSAGIERITFGTSENDFVKIQKTDANPLVKISFEDVVINSNLIGLYNANNINVAITIGKHFNIDNQSIKSAIEGYIPENNRSQLMIKDTNSIILDAYNANPSSMKVALENFAQLDKSNKIAFLGDMFELGNESHIEHQQIVNQLINSDIECYFVGKDFYTNKIEKSNFHFFENFEMLENNLKNTKFVDKNILIKGSRGMALERILKLI